MFDMGIGMGEMLLVGVIALIVLGPEKFPDYAKLFIRASRDLRSYLNELKMEIAKEVNPLKKELEPLKKELETLSREDPEKLIDVLAGTPTSDEGEYGKPPAGRDSSAGNPPAEVSGIPGGGVMEGEGAAYSTTPPVAPVSAASSSNGAVRSGASEEAEDPYDFEKNPPPERLD